VPVAQYSVAVKVTFWLAKLPGMGWLKLKEVLDVKNPTGTGVKPGVELTPPDAVSTQVTPQVTSKVSDGLVVDAPTIRTTTCMLEVNGFVTMTVQL